MATHFLYFETRKWSVVHAQTEREREKERESERARDREHSHQLNNINSEMPLAAAAAPNSTGARENKFNGTLLCLVQSVIL